MLDSVSASQSSGYSATSFGSRTQGSAEPGTARSSTAGTKQLSADQQQQVRALANTDRKVKAHEAAHLAAAGGLASSGASYTYTSGPDGQRYATGGEVQISLSEGRTPAETIARAEQVRAAALAPSDPSAQDQSVAAEASQMVSKARAEMARQTLQHSYGSTQPTGSQISTQA